MLSYWTVVALGILGLGVSAQLPCAPSTFASIAFFGGRVQSVTTANRTNADFNQTTPTNFGAPSVSGLSFCEVNVTYTHPGQNDTITVTSWLPAQNWNQRYVAVGGGGFSTGSGTGTLVAPVSLGYSAAYTDGGHPIAGVSVADWAYLGQGNINYALFEDFASVALNDLATIGKEVSTIFYGARPKYSYWSGCSTGGRQGHMMAQRYPTQFNGILATAPAFNWDKFVTSEFWPQFIMNQLGQYPRQCELNAITAAAIAACDPADGTVDGVVTNVTACTFRAQSVVGRSINCSSETGGNITISDKAAMVAQATWDGAKTADGKFQWYGLSRSAPLGGLANTTCSTNGICTGVPFVIATDWIKVFVVKDLNFTLKNITHQQWDRIFRLAVNSYASAIGTADPDLTDFKNAGGKLINWHGLDDQLISPLGSYDYFNRVQALDPDLRNYYRFFPAPGIFHCRGGPGGFPSGAFQALVDWVENGTAPTTISTTNTAGSQGQIYMY